MLESHWAWGSHVYRVNSGFHFILFVYSSGSTESSSDTNQGAGVQCLFILIDESCRSSGTFLAAEYPSSCTWICFHGRLKFCAVLSQSSKLV